MLIGFSLRCLIGRRRWHWSGDDDEPVRVVSIRPARHECQSLVGCRLNPLCVGDADLKGLVTVGQDVLFGDGVMIDLSSGIQVNRVVWLEVHQVSKHFAFDVVVPIEHGVARLSSRG